MSTYESTVSKSIEWYTPEWIFSALGNPIFDLDPCSPGQQNTHVPARKVFTIADDGLAQEWHGNVFLNPPFGRGVEKWLRKCHYLAASGGGSAIALVPSRTDTRWFQESMQTADIAVFLKGRVKFHLNDIHTPPIGSPGFGTALIGWGEYANQVLGNAHFDGFTCTPISNKNTTRESCRA